MLLVKKCQFSLILVLVQIRLEIRFNNLDRKETFIEYKNKIFQSPKNGIIPKMPFFSSFVFGQNKTRNEV